MFQKIKRILIGRSLRNDAGDSEKFSVLWGLPVLSSDAISSVSYACEEILMVLVPLLGMAAFKPLLGTAAAIVVLLFILVFSYRQTIDAYPGGGGSYSVAGENLGHVPGLVAAAALSIDYVLTVAVSASSGVAAITSAFPSLFPYKVPLTLGIISMLTLGNLRGVRESAILFGIPTYLFIVSILALIVSGLFKVLVMGAQPVLTPESFAQPVQELTLFLFLRAFASGCTALTGVEAVSNGIPNFREPRQKNARKVLSLLALIVLVIFGGVCALAAVYKIQPAEHVTVIAQIAMQVFGTGSAMFYVVQATTAVILIMAANTAYADLPLLMSLLARDGYMARQFSHRGARLSFSNGILMLWLLASLLAVVFKADTHLLLPLYAVGVFLSFTLSQLGMFRRWTRRREGNWKHKAFINGFGAIVTAITCAVIAVSKFAHGAWVVLILIPLLVLMMMRIKSHYDHVRDNLHIDQSAKELIFTTPPKNHILIPLATVNKSFIKALNYALTLNGDLEVYHVSTDKTVTAKVVEQYRELGVSAPLVIDEAPYRNVLEVLLEHVDQKHASLNKHEMLTVVLPQFVIPKWWNSPLHNQTALLLKSMLYRRRNLAVVSIPYIINE